MSTRVDGDEDGEDGEQDNHDQRLGAVDEAGTDQVDPSHRDHDPRGEDVVPAGRRVVADEERGRVAPEGDRHHRADDHDRREVAEPGGDPDQSPVPEPLEQVRDQPTRGRIADAQLDDVVAEQQRRRCPASRNESQTADPATAPASPSSAKMPAPTIAPMPRKAAPRTLMSQSHRRWSRPRRRMPAEEQLVAQHTDVSVTTSFASSRSPSLPQPNLRRTSTEWGRVPQGPASARPSGSDGELAGQVLLHQPAHLVGTVTVREDHELGEGGLESHVAP